MADRDLKADLCYHYGSFSAWWEDTLSADVEEIPLQGGQVNFTMKVGFDNAGEKYILLGNATGHITRNFASRWTRNFAS
ncbi:MAG: hypothetical protein ABIK28_01165 [Planctomycetota bacterium]